MNVVCCPNCDFQMNTVKLDSYLVDIKCPKCQTHVPHDNWYKINSITHKLRFEAYQRGEIAKSPLAYPQEFKIYVTFGRNHVHTIDGVVFDADCIAVIKAKEYSLGYQLAVKYFDHKFCFTHAVKPNLKLFPRGLIEVNEELEIECGSI